MSTHLNILLKHIDFDAISLKAGKHPTKSVSFRLFKSTFHFEISVSIIYV